MKYLIFLSYPDPNCIRVGTKYGVPAILAAVPLPLVHDTVPVLPAGVGQLLPHCPLEEPLRKVLFQRERPGIDVEKSCVQANFFTEPLKNLSYPRKPLNLIPVRYLSKCINAIKY